MTSINPAHALPRRGPRLGSAWAGFIDVTPDMLPVVDRPVSGLVLSTGYSGHGLGIAPAAGRVTASLALGGDLGEELRPFRLGRFRESWFVSVKGLV